MLGALPALLSSQKHTFTVKKIEAQRGEEICPRPQSFKGKAGIWTQVFQSPCLSPFCTGPPDAALNTREMIYNKCYCLVAQLCLTLCSPMDCNLPGCSVHGDSPGKNTGVGCHALLQGIFLTQGSNLGLLHCSCILYHLSHQGSHLCYCH